MAKRNNQEILLDVGTNEMEIMEFTIAGKIFGINVAKVLEIMTYQENISMPNSNQYIEGVFKPRDEIMTVINLPKYLNLPSADEKNRDILLVTIFNKVNLAFHVHTVETIHRISWEDIEKPDIAIYGSDFGLATGIARVGEKLITIIDFERILIDISPNHSINNEFVTEIADRQKTFRPILIAEDSPLLERLIMESLKKAGFTNVINSTNGQEAWEILKELKKYDGPIEEKISLIITDIEMPKMDGHKLTKLIRDDEKLSHLPIILFSSLISDEMKLKGKALGATAQITKPEIEKLISIIEENLH